MGDLATERREYESAIAADTLARIEHRSHPVSSDIRVADGITEPGAMLWHVSGTGDVTVFTALREDETAPFPNDRLIVAMTRGLYEPLRCFIDKARAETVADRARSLLGLRDRGRDEDGNPVG